MKKVEINYNDAKQLLRIVEFETHDALQLLEKLLRGFKVKGESIKSANEKLDNLLYLFITFSKAIEKGIVITNGHELVKFAKEQKLWFAPSDEK